MTRPGRTPECLSELRLVQLDARELDDAALATARRHVDGCARCAEALREIATDKAAFAAAPTPLWMARDRRRRPSRGSVLAIVAGGVAIAAGVILFVAPQRGSGTTADETGTRVKGGRIALRVLVERGGTAHPLAAGDVVHPGEHLRFTLRGHARAHVAVLSLDGAGAASIYVPAAGGDLVLALSSEVSELPGAIELDGTLGSETVFGLACRDAIDLEAVRIGLARDRALTPPVGCDVDRVVLSKTAEQP